MDTKSLEKINTLIEKTKCEANDIKSGFKEISSTKDKFRLYSYKNNKVITYFGKNYYLFLNQDEGIPFDKIEVIFLFDDSKSLLESQSFYFYSFNSIINACNILNFKKPFIISNKLTCKQVRAKILFNNSIDNLFTQLTKLEKITKSSYDPLLFLYYFGQFQLSIQSNSLFESLVTSIGNFPSSFLIFGSHLCKRRDTILKLFLLQAQCNAVPILGKHKSQFVSLHCNKILTTSI